MEPAEIEPLTYRVTARNTARASPNKIHDEAVATRYGFAGGLVPGVTIFAWMCAAPLDAFGPGWLELGRIHARFVGPVYEGDEIVVDGIFDDLGLVVGVRRDDVVCAAGRASAGHDDDFEHLPAAPIPAAPPAASPASLAPGRSLGAVEVPFESDRAREYLTSIDADHPTPAERRVAHPGWVLLLGNLALSSNVALGPWIHVSSDVRLHGTVADGEAVSARSRVVAEYERKEHRFVELDVAVVAGADRPVASIRHVAIYAPRRPSE